jgi:hypothetical protein
MISVSLILAVAFVQATGNTMEMQAPSSLSNLDFVKTFVENHPKKILAVLIVVGLVIGSGIYCLTPSSSGDNTQADDEIIVELQGKAGGSADSDKNISSKDDTKGKIVVACFFYFCVFCLCFSAVCGKKK